MQLEVGEDASQVMSQPQQLDISVASNY